MSFDSKVKKIMSLGFERKSVEEALRANSNDVERAIIKLQAVQNPAGTSTFNKHQTFSNASCIPVTDSEKIEDLTNKLMNLGSKKENECDSTNSENKEKSLEYVVASTSNSNTDHTLSYEQNYDPGYDDESDDMDDDLLVEDPLVAIRQSPYFQTIRYNFFQNPKPIEEILETLKNEFPEMHRVVLGHEREFYEMLTEPAILPPSQLSRANVQLGGEWSVKTTNTENTTMLNQMSRMLEEDGVEMSQADMAVIGRLMAMGFNRLMAVQAYFACDKDENRAANFLISQDDDDDDQFETEVLFQRNA